MRDKSAALLSHLGIVAARHHGLVTHAEAMAAGLNRKSLSRLVRSGTLLVVHPRVFRLGVSPESSAQRLLAACLWLGGDALISHRSAANLWGLKVKEPAVEVTIARRDSRRAPGLLVHRTDVPSEDRRVLRGIPATSVARTLIDLATCLDEDQLAIVVEDAWWRKLAAPDWVERRLGKLARGRDGAKALRRVLADCRRRGVPLESALEVRLWRLLKRSRLRLPELGYPFADDFGQPGRIDFAYPGHQLAVEADGYGTHGDREAFERDRVRYARLAALGWRVLPVTWRQVDERPAKVVERIRRALQITTAGLDRLRRHDNALRLLSSGAR